MIGKKIRLERIMDRNTHRMVIVPMDHGVTVGPIPGLIQIPPAANLIAEGGANAAVVHRGAAMFGHRGYGKDLGLILHLSASTSLSPDSNRKVLVATVEDALQMGADAVSIHVNLGADDEAQMLRDFGSVSSACQRWGMPLLSMIYTRGPKVKNEFDVRYVRHAARVGAEMGADIVKVPYTGTPETFREVVDGCASPVVIAGGEKMESDEEVLRMVRDSISAGGAGASIGRNVFQHRHPASMVKAIVAIVHGGATVQEALGLLKSKGK
ncbi:MAG: fructose-bisphosphate aldolase, class I [Actinobacteria bacterium]|nr:fructose-bisphosphate aldolase, class I [Actinomycetota bacterium]MBM2828324.1 fructose-bisphosphate aldolase, class [Actinomycetota bacterium]